MGLDVYLYRIDDYAKYKALTNEYEKRSEATWAKAGKYESLTDEQKEAVRKDNADTALSLGLEEDGDYPGMVKIEHASRLYPDHYFKIGYLRSSYNEGGIDCLLRDRLSTSLSDIFEADAYEFQPDWQATRERAIKALEDWRALNASMGGKAYRVSRTPTSMFVGRGETVESSAAALRVFQKQLETHRGRNGDMLNFGNREGDFFLGEPLKVAGLIPGIAWGKEPTVYMIWEATSDDWYTQALEIVIENCEWVLEQPDKELYWLHWSS